MFLVAVFVMLVILAAFFLIFEDAPDIGYARFIISTDHTIASYRFFPVIIRGTNIYRLIVLAVGFVLTVTLKITGEKLRNKIKELRIKVQFEALKKAGELKVVDKAGAKKSKHVSRTKLRRLLKAHSRIKEKLDEMSRKLIFLSIDIVGSTTMKIDEDPSVVECDFIEYKRYVEKKLSGNNCMKSTWTPDGVLSCFEEFESAFKAAREVITELGAFNEKIKSIKSDFAVRCGINSGNIHFDDTIPLEDITHRTIDIAAHVQRRAKPNTLYVTQHSIRPPQLLQSFQPAYEKIDDCPLYVWGNKVELD